MAVVKCILAEQNKGGQGSLILKDTITEIKYNLIVENGFLTLQEVSDVATENDNIQMIDVATGRVYKLTIENTILTIQEV